MFDDQTCLILGAGASRPYGFPTSGELRKLMLGEDSNIVLKNLGFALPIQAADTLEKLLLECAYSDRKRLQRFRTVFGESQRVSIDAFLSGLPESHYNMEMKQIARGSIAAVLLLCEQAARLNGNWYQWLLEFLLRNGKSFPAKRLSIVTFNYDRSLEQFLFRAFLRSFDLDPSSAREMLERIEIVHVYGSLGPILMDAHPDPTVFGDLNRVPMASSLIAPATPRAAEKTQKRVRELVDEAARLIFLGFGFWNENLDLLYSHQPVHSAEAAYSFDPPEHWANKKVFASRYLLGESTVFDVNDRVGTVENIPIIQWGDKTQDIWDFVNHVSLKS